MVWETNGNTVSKAEAKTKIIEMAKTQGIKGAFKVFHKGQLMTTPDDLPEQVAMSDIWVSAVLDQA